MGNKEYSIGNKKFLKTKEFWVDFHGFGKIHDFSVPPAKFQAFWAYPTELTSVHI